MTPVLNYKFFVLLQIQILSLLTLIVLSSCIGDTNQQEESPLLLTSTKSIIDMPSLDTSSPTPFNNLSTNTLPTITISDVNHTLDIAETPTSNSLLPQISLTPIPTLSTEWISNQTILFAPLKEPKDFIAVTSNNALWHPDSSLANSLPIPAGWHIHSWSPDGQYLALNEWNGRIGVLDLGTGIFNIIENTSTGTASWSPDGRYLVVSDRQNFINVFSLINHKLESVPNSFGGILPEGRLTAWSPNGQYLFYREFTGGNAPFPVAKSYIYDVNAKQVVAELESVSLWKWLGWSFDSKQFAFITWHSTHPYEQQLVLQVFDIETGQQQSYQNLSTHIWINGYWSPKSNQILLSGTPVKCGPDIPLGNQFAVKIDRLGLLDTNTGQIEFLAEPVSDGQCSNSSFEYTLGYNPWNSSENVIMYAWNKRLCILSVLDLEEHCLEDLYSSVIEAGYQGISSPSWSPDNAWIAIFIGNPYQYGEFVAVVRPDGTDLNISTHLAIPEDPLLWHPNEIE